MRNKRLPALALTLIMITGLIPVMPGKMDVAKAADTYTVTVSGHTDTTTNESHMTLSPEDKAQQTVAAGSSIDSLTCEPKTGYYFPDDYTDSIEAGNGIKVTRHAQGIDTWITISGKPTADTTISLNSASKKKTQSPPQGLTTGELRIIGTDSTMEYSDSANGPWTSCAQNSDVTNTSTGGTKYVRYAADYDRLASAAVTVDVKGSSEEEETPTVTYSVQILNPKGSHINISARTDQNASYQPKVGGTMTPVYYYAESGYEFPTSYSVDSVNGVRVTRNGPRTLIVSGTPTKDTVITLEPASEINTRTYSVNVVNGTGGGTYISGVTVTIKAASKSGKTFTNWKVNKGNIVLTNVKASTTTFVMKSSNVEIEACYETSSSGGSANNNSSTNNSSNSSSSNTVTGSSIYVLSSEVVQRNSNTLDLSAKVKWKSGGWRVTWSAVSGADGYDVLAGQGKKSLNSSGTTVENPGNSSTTANIKTINKKAVKKTKTYEFQVKAYRIVNRSKEYIGTSRILYVAGSKNKKYTNIKKIKPSKKSVTVGTGKSVKLKTGVKKQKSSKTIVSGRNGKKLYYISSNTGIATVNSSGKVTGVARGNCTIYIIAYNGVKSSVAVHVD